MDNLSVEKTVSQNRFTGTRPKRYFSDALQQQVVKEIETGVYSKAEAARIYQVVPLTIYNWLHKHSLHFQKQIITVCELESESEKRKKLERQVGDFEKIIGQMSVENIFLKELLAVISERYEIDFKKNINTKSYSDLEHVKALIKELSKHKN